MTVSSAGHGATGQSRPILMVEDNEMDLDLCMQAFAEHAVANPFIVCRDGEEALDFINAHPTGNAPQLPLRVDPEDPREIAAEV